MLLVQRAAAVGTPILIGIVVVRVLGPVEFGVYTFAVLSITAGQLLAEFGLDKFLPREFAVGGSISRIFARWLGFKLAAAAITYVLLLLLFPLLMTTAYSVALIAVGGVTLFTHAYSSTYRSALLALGQTRRLALASVSGAAVSLTLTAATLAGGVGLLVVVVGGMAIGGLVELAVLAHGFGGGQLLQPSRPRLLRDVAHVWEFGVHAILAVVYMRVGVFMLALAGGAGAVSSYSMGSNVYAAVVLLPAASALVSYPELARAVALRDRERFLRVLTRHAYGTALVALPLFTAALAFSDNIMQLLYGFTDSTSSSVLRVVSAAFVLFSVNAILAVGLLALNGQRALARLSLMTCALSVVLNVVLVLSAGEIGAAVALLTADAFTVLALWRVVQLALLSAWPGTAR